MKNVRFMTEAEIMSETPADSDKKSDKIRLFPFKCLKNVNEFLWKINVADLEKR